MRESMVLVLSVICERHGELGCHSGLGAFPGCTQCAREGHPDPHPVRIASEPVKR